MRSRIHGYLDGDLPIEALTVEEREQVTAYEAVVDVVTRSLPTDDPRDLVHAIQARVGALETSSHSRVALRLHAWIDTMGRTAGWFWNPRTIRLRPIAVVAAAALAVVLMMPSIRSTPQPIGAPLVFVQFRLDAPTASSVYLAGDFTGWQPTHALRQTAPGVWSVMVPLESGVHQYAFVVDGEQWIPDPLATQVNDGFGGANSQLSVWVPEAERRS